MRVAAVALVGIVAGLLGIDAPDSEADRAHLSAAGSVHAYVDTDPSAVHGPADAGTVDTQSRPTVDAVAPPRSSVGAAGRSRLTIDGPARTTAELVVSANGERAPPG